MKQRACAWIQSDLHSLCIQTFAMHRPGKAATICWITTVVFHQLEVGSKHTTQIPCKNYNGCKATQRSENETVNRLQLKSNATRAISVIHPWYLVRWFCLMHRQMSRSHLYVISPYAFPLLQDDEHHRSRNTIPSLCNACVVYNAENIQHPFFTRVWEPGQCCDSLFQQSGLWTITQTHVTMHVILWQ